ncbi:MAG: PKD domain-containing protein [Flavobacteriia bacterium]
MIKRLLAFFILLFMTIGGAWGQLNANFSTNPLYNTSNQLNVCAGSSVLFTFISTGSNISSATSVNWTFTTNSGTALSQTTSTLRTPFPLTFPNGTYTITLTLSEPSGALSSKTITVNATSAPPVSPSLTLSTFSVTAGWNSTTIEGVPAFSICPVNLNLSQDVTFDITPSLNCAQVTSITHTEVPSSTPIDCNNGYIDITYNPNTARFYYSVFSVQFTTCTFSRVYYVQIGTPSISITSASSTACDPGTYSLAFIDQTPGVTYQIDWDYNGTSFNSQSVYAYPNLPINPQKASHSYPFTPCVNGVVQPNEIKVRASNTSCPGYSETSPSQVFVSQAPEASFTRNPDVDVICQGTQVTYTDNSNPGVFVTAPGSCNTTYHRWWTHSPAAFGPGTTNTANVSNLGTSSNSNPGPASFTVTYNQPGTYTIRLIVKNNSCANDTMIKTVCVVPAVQANFNASATTGCAPIAVTTTNNSSLPGCPGTNMLYNWSVSNATATCGTPAWNYTNNTNSNSAQPQFSFTGPGIYTIRLVSSLNPSVAGAQCQNDTITQTITVKGPPIIDLPPPSPICQGQAFIPQATVNDCYTTSSTYAWTFNSGTPASSTILNPGSITYSNYGNFTFSLSATNECGTDTENSTITVNQAAVVVANANSTSCSGQAISLSGSVTGGATGGAWTSSAGGNFLPNSTTLNASFVPSPGATGSVTLTLTATGVVAPCPAELDEVTITLNANPIAMAGNDTSICAGSTVLLQGSIGGAATSATWSTTGSGTFQSVSSLNTIYTPSAADISAGSVSLILTTNDPAGPCDPAKDTLNVVIIPIPTLTVGSSSAVCSGVAFSIPLTPSITSPPASYAWALSGSLPTGVTTTTSGTIAAPNSQFTGTVQNLSTGPVTLQYLITATVNGCNSTSTPVSVVINPLPQPLITPPGPITACNGTSVTLTTSVFSSYLWSTNATTQSISVNAAGNYTVTVTNSYGCTGTSAATVVNFSEPLTPTFNQVTPICYNGTFSLPTTSINGISGTWSPTINPLATTTYTFTPSSGQCANTAQMTVTVNPLPIPTVTANGPLTFCQGSSVVLTATGGGTYVWNLNGAVIPNATSSSLTATQAGNYTVTVTNANGCSATSSVQVLTVNPLPQPTITASGAVNLCQGQSITLSTGTFDSYLWSSGQISSSITVSTAGTYSVNVTSGGCTGTSNTIVVTINPVPAAAISGTATVCENGAQPNITFTGSNSTAPYTFTYSINGGANQTITTSPTSSSVTLPVPTATTGTFTYTLSNVAVGACSSAVTAQAATITVSANIIPTFTQVGPYCNGASIPALPTTSNNSIVGSWAPAINNTASAAAVTTNYTFTPTAGAGICATTATMAIVVNPNTIPLFTQLGPYCQGATPDVLPLTANNNIAGTWSPATISTAGIIGAVSSTTYTFTPNIQDANAPQCALPGTMTILVTPLPGATISGDTTLCQGSNLPVVVFTGSNSAGPYTFTYNINGGANQTITTPANSSVVTLPVPTSVPGAFIYNLTGVSVGGCTNAITAQNVTVNVIQTPTVSLAASTTLICPNEPVVLTATGNPATFNNVQGSYAWSNTTTITSNIQTVNPVTVGPNNYTVTYTLNNCTSQPATVTISVQTAPQITIQNSPNATICEGGCVILSAVPSASTIIPSSYSWSTGETTQSITVCPTDTTTYTVIGLSGTCQSPLASTVVNVMPDPVFSTALIPDTSICVGGSFTFNVAVSGGVGTPTYNWYLNNQPNNFSGISLPNSNNAAYSTPTIIQPSTQYYYVEVTYPGLGCDQIVSQVASLNVVADPIVTIDPLFNQTLCEGGTATCIVPEITGGVGTNTYLWIPTMSADSIFCPPSDQLGTLNYNVIVQQSGIGCGSLPSNTVSITVISDPTIQIVGLDAVCEGAEVPLITAVQGGLGTIANYQWSQSYPNGNPYQDIVGANAFNYTTVVLTDQIGIAVEMNQTVEGCNATDTLLINVYDDPQVSIIGDSMTCMGLDNLLQAVVSGGVPNSTNTFTWFSPGTELNPNPTIVQGAGLFNIFSGTIISDTSFFVTLDNSGFGCDNDTSAIFAIDAIEWAIANFEIDPEIPSQSILTPTFSFINSSQNATSYYWDLGECDPQLPMSELYTTPTLTYNPNSIDQMNYTYGCSPGYYSVTLYAYNQGMCPDTVTQIIRIRDEVIVYVPNAFTPGDLDNTNPTFYPVITGKIKPGTYRFSIFNRWGELIYETYEPTDQWDGRYNKTPIAQSGAISNDEFVQDGVYIWKLSFIAEETGDKIEKVGHVTKLKSDKDN